MNTNSRNVTYSTVGDYQLPNLTLNQPRKPLGKYGRLRRTYLMNHRPVLYNTCLLYTSRAGGVGTGRQRLPCHPVL